MWSTEIINARTCAKKFTDLMGERPQCWSDNLINSVNGLEDEMEQMKFLAWCGDPTNACGSSTRTFVKKKITDERMEKHPDYEVTRVVQGRTPTFHVTYKPLGSPKVEPRPRHQTTPPKPVSYKPNGVTECTDEKVEE
jgi:hypothetical protein